MNSFSRLYIHDCICTCTYSLNPISMNSRFHTRNIIGIILVVVISLILGSVAPHIIGIYWASNFNSVLVQF